MEVHSAETAPKCKDATFSWVTLAGNDLQFSSHAQKQHIKKTLKSLHSKGFDILHTVSRITQRKPLNK